MRPILVSLAFIFVWSIANSQVRTNINNGEVITARGKFKKNYSAKASYRIPPKDIKALHEKEMLENKTGESRPVFFTSK